MQSQPKLPGNKRTTRGSQNTFALLPWGARGQYLRKSIAKAAQSRSLLSSKVHVPNAPRDLPGQMTEVRIHRSTNHLAVEFLKFFCPITKSADLHGAPKGEAKSIKEECNIFSFVVRWTDIFELSTGHNSHCFEVGTQCPILVFSEDVLLQEYWSSQRESTKTREDTHCGSFQYEYLGLVSFWKFSWIIM